MQAWLEQRQRGVGQAAGIGSKPLAAGVAVGMHDSDGSADVSRHAVGHCIPDCSFVCACLVGCRRRLPA